MNKLVLTIFFFFFVSAAVGKGFIAKSMGIRNTAGPEKNQAVALRVQSDMSAFINCRIDGYQGTLYAQTHRQFYKNCVISGTIDFIFGDSAAVFQNCLMVVRKPMDQQQNTVTAHGRKDKRESTGFVIQHCRVVAEKKLFPTRLITKTYLGRPWKEHSRTVVMESSLDDRSNHDTDIPVTMACEQNLSLASYLSSCPLIPFLIAFFKSLSIFT